MESSANSNSITRVLRSSEETEEEAARFIEALRADSSHSSSATLIALSGELGAGKTTFAQSVAKALGIVDVVNSPTFVIEKIYVIPETDSSTTSRFSRLVHIDAYRLQNISDLTMLGFGELMSHPRTLVLLEWPERVLGIAEQASVKILLEHLPDGTRQITYA